MPAHCRGSEDGGLNARFGSTAVAAQRLRGEGHQSASTTGGAVSAFARITDSGQGIIRGSKGVPIGDICPNSTTRLKRYRLREFTLSEHETIALLIRWYGTVELGNRQSFMKAELKAERSNARAALFIEVGARFR